ncbi:uncharacterized protein CDAR_496571 [Caerostris darwini]|uniref:Uncharacterized protein n=1 Tax=Caerostris darwini TaxID=1538125 RepID=A0AAV4QI57_9ARAC|nr:uncharacterized protein CDAR_496571 [Caerostris darwini]
MVVLTKAVRTYQGQPQTSQISKQAMTVASQLPPQHSNTNNQWNNARNLQQNDERYSHSANSPRIRDMQPNPSQDGRSSRNLFNNEEENSFTNNEKSQNKRFQQSHGFHQEIDPYHLKDDEISHHQPKTSKISPTQSPLPRHPQEDSQMYKRQFLSPNAEPHGPPVQNQKPRRPIRLFTDSYDSAVDKHLEEKGEKRHGVSEKVPYRSPYDSPKAFIQEEASQEHSQWESGEISPLYPAKINRQQKILGPPEDEFRSPRQIQTGETFQSSPEQRSNLPSQSHFRSGFQYPKESPRSALNADKLINKDLNKQFKNNLNKGPSDGDDFDLNSRSLGRQSAPQSHNSYGMLESFTNEEDLRGRSQSNLQAPYPPTLQRPVLKMEDARTLPPNIGRSVPTTFRPHNIPHQRPKSEEYISLYTSEYSDGKNPISTQSIQSPKNSFRNSEGNSNAHKYHERMNQPREFDSDYLSEQPPVSHRTSQDTDPTFPLTPADHRIKKNHERFEHPHKVPSEYSDDDVTSYRQTNRNPINTYTQSLKDDQTHKYLETPRQSQDLHSKYLDENTPSSNGNPKNSYARQLSDKQNERHRDPPNYPEEALNYGGLPLNQKINPQISQQELMLSSLKGQQAEFQGYSVDKNNPQPDKYYPSQNYNNPNSRVKSDKSLDEANSFHNPGSPLKEQKPRELYPEPDSRLPTEQQRRYIRQQRSSKTDNVQQIPLSSEENVQTIKRYSVEQVKPRNVTARNQAQDHIIGMGSETELDAEPADNDDVFDDEEKHDGFLDMGAYTDKQGSFGWYADFPVGRGHDKVSYSSS